MIIDHLTLETMSPRDIEAAIVGDEAATARMLRYLDDRKIPHPSRVTSVVFGLVLAAFADSYTDTTARKVENMTRKWRSWRAEGEMPIAEKRLIIAAAFYDPANKSA